MKTAEPAPKPPRKGRKEKPDRSDRRRPAPREPNPCGPDRRDIVAAIRRVGLEAFGSFHPSAHPGGAPAAAATLILLGPREPGFWKTLRQAPEFADGSPHPLDRWSRRIIDGLACALGAEPFYPFGGPPFHPFIAWALRSGRAFISPTGLLVHDRAGLTVSYRGALFWHRHIAMPEGEGVSPCESCSRPCLDACPVGALGGGDYDVVACRRHAGSDAGRDCRDEGCRVRRACPLSRRYGRAAALSAFHMRAFLAADKEDDKNGAMQKRLAKDTKS